MQNNKKERRKKKRRWTHAIVAGWENIKRKIVSRRDAGDKSQAT